MLRRPHEWLPLVIAGMLVAGCTPSRRPVPFSPPNARALAPTDDACPPGVALSPEDPGCGPMRRPREVLALSGGGAYGAYTAGFLSGWSASGTRPDFDV